MSGAENLRDCDSIEMLIGSDIQVQFMDDFERVVDVGYIVGQTKVDIIFSNRFLNKNEPPKDGCGISYISNTTKWVTIKLAGQDVITPEL